jgi:hypothetical protein
VFLAHFSPGDEQAEALHPAAGVAVDARDGVAARGDEGVSEEKRSVPRLGTNKKGGESRKRDRERKERK